MEPVHIEVRHADGRGYPIDLAEGLGLRLLAALDALGVGAQRVFVSTAPIWRTVRHLLPEGLPDADVVLMADGERHKQLPAVSRLYDALMRAGADRATTVVAIGGGVVGDTAGFAAATYMRGLPIVHVPTTLVAQVDSAIGGKVGVNHPLAKNLVGAFHRPLAVLGDPRFLATLPRREFRAGLYEVVKYGAVASVELFTRVSHDLRGIFARSADVLLPVIADCCRIKARVVAADEREAGERRILNFGHTAGHALEALTKYRRFRHGEAVGYGMLVAARLAVARGAMPADDCEALAQAVTHMGPLPPVADLAADQVLEAMRLDKKVRAGRLHFVIPRRIGAVEVVDDVTDGELRAAMVATGLRG